MALQPDLYFISMAARLLDMHPQTLRKYERLGLVTPTRTSMRVAMPWRCQALPSPALVRRRRAQTTSISLTAKLP